MDRPNAWKEYTEEQLDQLHYLCEGYKAFISDNKTERECCAASVAMAEEAGFKKLANIILAGKLFAETRFCEEETLWKAIEKCVPAKKAAMLDMNKRALQLGIDA